MTKLNADKILKEAGRLYAKSKLERFPDAPPTIYSDQIRAVCIALVNALNERLSGPLCVRPGCKRKTNRNKQNAV